MTFTWSMPSTLFGREMGEAMLSLFPVIPNWWMRLNGVDWKCEKGGGKISNG